MLCLKCKAELPLEKFAPVGLHKQKRGYDSWCRLCRNENQRTWRRNHAEQVARSRRRVRIKEEYDLLENDYLNMLQKQNNKCLICKNDFIARPNIDHDHKTNQVRGLLCSACNVGLGMFKDNVEFLLSAINYLNGVK